MEDQVVEEQLKEIEYIASDELNVGLIERYLQELPEKYFVWESGCFWRWLYFLSAYSLLS